MSSDETTCETLSKPKHGGSRQKITWEDKLSQLDRDRIRDFLCSKSCGRACKCIYKLMNMGDKGVDIVFELRQARLAGKQITMNAGKIRGKNECFTMLRQCFTTAIKKF